MNHPNLPIDPRPRVRRTISQLLEDFLDGLQGEDFTLVQLLAALGPRAYGMTILIFALPNMVLGGVPGVSTVLTLPILLLAIQMMIGLNRPWVPKFAANISFERKNFALMVEKSKPYLNRIERFFRPRWMWLTGTYAKHVLGAFCIIVSLVLMLPVVFGNFLPSTALALVAIGLIERDGFCIVGGALFGLAGTIYAMVFYGSIAQFLLHVVH
jgi:hypothetical protein